MDQRPSGRDPQRLSREFSRELDALLQEIPKKDRPTGQRIAKALGRNDGYVSERKNGKRAWTIDDVDVIAGLIDKDGLELLGEVTARLQAVMDAEQTGALSTEIPEDPTAGSGGFVLHVAEQMRDRFGADWMRDLGDLAAAGKGPRPGLAARRQWRKADQRAEELAGAARRSGEDVERAGAIYSGAEQWLSEILAESESISPEDTELERIQYVRDHLRDGLHHELYTDEQFAILTLVLDDMESASIAAQAQSDAG